ncbi:hypothetical protein HWV62_7788 [Athelia sp. TMB]|nr:hypothetical protein HWV62_7788 [Athelia sp. TMB]
MSRSVIPDSHLDSVILKSSDSAYLRASRALLSFASPILKDMIALPAEESKDGLPVVQLAENGRTVEHLISLCSQRWEKHPDIRTVAEFAEVMTAAKAYKMDGAMRVIKNLLLDSPLLEKEPLGCFALAKYFGLQEPAIGAAKHSLSLPLFPRPLHAESGRITAGDYALLQVFYNTCQTAFCDIVKGVLTTLPFQNGGLFPLQSKASWISRDSFVWLTCTSCSPASRLVKTASGKTFTPRQWWCEYLDWVQSRFATSPSLAILSESASLDYAIERTHNCATCRKRVAQDVQEFNKMLLAELNRIVHQRDGQTADSLRAVQNALKLLKPIATSGNRVFGHPPAVGVLPIFKETSADLIIKSSDNMSFRVHKIILSLSSPTFATMFTLPAPPSDDTPIVDVSEGSETLQHLLQFCYPAPDPEIKSPQGVQAVLEAATKYEMDAIKERVAKRLEPFIKDNALSVYTIAYRYKLDGQVRLAAKQLLHEALSAKYVAELEFIPASALYQFQDYHYRCRSAVFQRFSKDGLSWVKSTRSSASSLTLLWQSYIWFTCPQCPKGSPVKMKEKQELKTTKWWSDYMVAVSSALYQVPHYSNNAVTSAKNRALETAVNCSACRQAEVITQMSEFQADLAAEVQAAVDSTSGTEIRSALPDSHADDVILKSSDNMYLRASRALLSSASPVLNDKIALPAEESKDNLPVIQLTEHSRTLKHLISICSPKWIKNPIIPSISEFGEVMTAAKAYKMDGAMQIIENLFLNSPLLKLEPLGCFALAKYFGLQEPAIVTAMYTLSLPLFSRPFHTELDRITGGDYARLQNFYGTCQASFCVSIQSVLVALPATPFAQLLRESKASSWMTRDSFVWLTCTSCPPATHEVMTASGKAFTPRKWWCDYLDWILSKFLKSPPLSILSKNASIDYAIDRSHDCAVCRKFTVQDVQDFNKMLLAELNRIVCQNAQKLLHPIITSGSFTGLFSPSLGRLKAPKPSPPVVLPIFKEAGADLIIRSSDKVSLRVHKIILSLSSPIFATMFTLPPALAEDTAIVDVSEESRVLGNRSSPYSTGVIYEGSPRDEFDVK